MIKTFKERLKVSVKWFLPLFLFTFLPLLSCSESEDEVTNEYANWQTRNEAYITDIAKKCQRVKVFTKDQQAEGPVSDYVYYEVLEQGEGGEERAPESFCAHMWIKLMLRSLGKQIYARVGAYPIPIPSNSFVFRSTARRAGDGKGPGMLSGAFSKRLEGAYRSASGSL